MIEIKEVKSKSDLKKFVNFVVELYKDDNHFCPPLVFDEINTFDKKKNPAHKIAKSVLYLAYKNGKIVGRIAGIINDIANKAWCKDRLRFGWFDFIDDQEVSFALLDAVKSWGKHYGMTEMNGPVGFTDFDHQGLLIEGFEYVSPFISLYNFPYYIKHLENYGFVKDADWIEYRIYTPEKIPEKMERVAKIVMDKYNLKIVKVKKNKDIIDKIGYRFFDLINEAYSPLYNYQPLTDEQKKYYSKMYFPLLNYDFLTLIENEKGELVGAGVCMPSLTKALQKSKGKIFPFGWYHILKSLKAKQFDCLDLLLVAVRPDYQGKGVNALFFYDQIKYGIKYGVKYSESTAILETNTKNQAQWEYFDIIKHKRRRAYIKSIE